MERINELNPDEIVIHYAANHTNETLKNLILDNPNVNHMVEGQYIVLHFPHDLWVQIKNPVDKIDAIDFIYITQLSLLGKTEPIMSRKLIFLTNYRAPWFMYFGYDHCGFSLQGAAYTVRWWNEEGFPSWGIGHEIGHYVEILGTGMLHEANSIESWCNILNVYSFYRLGYFEWARGFVSRFASDFSGSEGIYNHLSGVNFDALPDHKRTRSILAANQWVFVELPILLIDNYGWEGIKQFFTNIANDFAHGMVASTEIQDRIDYQVIMLSIVFKMDLSALFDHWMLSPSDNARAEISHLPPERIIAESYGIIIS
jgi:hypothetical protein